jgi:hypothetical protein
MKMRMNLFDFKANVKPLSEEKAIEIGSNFIAEVLIFGIGLICVDQVLLVSLPKHIVPVLILKRKLKE